MYLYDNTKKKNKQITNVSGNLNHRKIFWQAYCVRVTMTEIVYNQYLIMNKVHILFCTISKQLAIFQL